MKSRSFGLSDPKDHQYAAQLWSAAFATKGETGGQQDWFTISPEFVAYNTSPVSGALQAGQIVWDDAGDAPLGFVLASATTSKNDPEASMGWVDALAVHPEQQRHGVGNFLLAWAEKWLCAQGCDSVRLGGSLRPFLPGRPALFGEPKFFLQHGYAADADAPYEWDVARCLDDYVTPGWVKPLDAQVQPLRDGEQEELLAFLRAQFPGRWQFEYEEHLRESGPTEDYIVLRVEGEMMGFCITTTADSPRPLNRFYPQRLPPPWGQLGSIGIARRGRGKGYGGALIDGGLRHLRDKGVVGCVIDWTTLLDLYGKFGFTPYTQYLSLYKELK